MHPSVVEELNKEKPGKFEVAMLNHVRGLIAMSRSDMGKYYTSWDLSDATYRGIRMPDKDDEKQDKKGEPIKMVVPLSFAQVQTFIAFCFLLFTQNARFFSYGPTGSEDYPIRKDCEAILARDLRSNKWPAILYQFLLDIARFGLGIIEHGWKEDYQYVPTEVTEPPTKFFGVEIKKGKIKNTVAKILKYQGNKINNISPFRWFPDTRLPLSRFQEGEFCGSEEEYSKNTLKEMESNGEVSGVKYIPEMSEELFNKRGVSRVGMFQPTPDGGKATGHSGDGITGTKNLYLVTKVQVNITPSEFEVDDEKLGEEDYQVKYIVWYANDQRVIRCEPMNNLHNQFGYDASEFSPDMHRLINQGLSEVIDKLQSVVAWFINSHIRAVSRAIDNRIVADPAGVDVASIEAKSPVIWLKKGASKTGVDRWVKQLQVVDTTGAHMSDADALTKMISMVTGINDNAMGQYNPGRRAAYESKVVTAGAASRLKTTAKLIWTTGLDPAGQKLLTNSRQGIEEESFARIIGRPDATDPEAVAKFQERFLAFKGTPEELVGSDDFFVLDDVLSAEKSFLAQSLQEFLQVVLENPITAQVLDIDPKGLFDMMMELRGFTNLDTFSLSKRIKEEQKAGNVTQPLPTSTAQPTQVPQPTPQIAA